MLTSLASFGGQTMLAITACLAAGLVFTVWRVTRRNRGIVAALDNMSQGLCMFDGNARITVCNKPYLEMYGLSGEVVRPGCTLRELIDHRKQAGFFKGDVEAYCRDILANVAKGEKFSATVETTDGRVINVINRPVRGGGWVATHADITDRKRLEREREGVAAQEGRRAAIDKAIATFRERAEALLKSVADSAVAMSATATTLSGASGLTSERTEGAVGASSDAAMNVQTAAAAADELAGSIAEISRQLVQTTDVVTLAVNEAQGTNQEIQALAQSAQKIGDVVKLIRDIAGQTNLLALNATIEAARAGEAGRGFAVVAAEVKSLAVQTAKATEDITGQITALQTSATGAVDAIERITGRMQEISSYTSAVAASVEQQNSATGQIAENVSGAAKGTTMVAGALSEVSQAATQTSASAATVLDTAKSVERTIGNLRGEVETFLKTVAA
jgi:methyl-accepting chemotaxis protein